MKFTAALRLPDLPCLALVGAGGKSSALLCLARELAQVHRTVLVTTTTHLGEWQVGAGDGHVVIQAGEPLEAGIEFPRGVVFVTGPVNDDQRVGGLNTTAIGQLNEVAKRKQYPLLIEADGARQLPLKAPAEHEPVITEFVEQVVVCAGLSGLGKPLSGVWVHRPERFGGLSGLEQGELITPEAVSRVLMHPQGGLKGMPEQARRILLLNQADTEEEQAQANTIAQQCMQAFHAVIVAALDKSAEDSGTIEDKAAQSEIYAVHEAMGGIVLAAGGATRYGALKQLLLWKGSPLVRHAARAALQAGLSPVVVVTGAGAELVAQAVAGLPVRQVRNDAWQQGQSISLQAGLRALPPTSGGAIFLLADQPNITPGLIQALVEAHSQSLAPIVAPLVDGQRGNPVLFDAVTFADLLQLNGDAGGRQLFRKYALQYVPWHDRSVLQDIDQPEDYARLSGEERGRDG